MTASERAKFKRMDERRSRLFSALCVIKTWLSFADDPQQMLYQIGALVTERIMDEQSAARKEEMREMKGGAK